MIRLFVLIFLLVPQLSWGQSSLPPCPIAGVKHQCVGEMVNEAGVYTGEFQHGKLHGFGRFRWPDGSTLVGTWAGGVGLEGEGIIYNPDGTIKFSGRWANDKLVAQYSIDVRRFPLLGIPSKSNESNISPATFHPSLVKGHQTKDGKRVEVTFVKQSEKHWEELQNGNLFAKYDVEIADGKRLVLIDARRELRTVMTASKDYRDEVLISTSWTRDPAKSWPLGIQYFDVSSKVDGSKSVWKQCAEEGEVCRFNGIGFVRYGSNSGRTASIHAFEALCSNSVFNDPSPGNRKSCEYVLLDASSEEIEAASKRIADLRRMPGWTICAEEGKLCLLDKPTRIRFGVPQRFYETTSAESFTCGTGTFGDPAVGVRKFCYVNATDGFIQAQQVASPKNPHALIIGNAAYPGSSRLDNPINDAKAIEQKLKSMGFTVTVVTDANRQRLVQAMSQFRKTASNADLSLLFYSGHGVQIFGTNYILPVDVDQSDVAQATIQGVSLNSVVENFLPGKTKIVFLDACRDNPLQRSNDRSVSKGLAPISVAQGTLIAYATKDGQTASDGVGQKNSPFTKALLEHLSDPQDIAVILRKVREKVMTATGGKQQPWEYGSLTGGELVLGGVKR